MTWYTLFLTVILIFMSFCSFGQNENDSIKIHQSLFTIYSQNGERVRMSRLLKLTKGNPEANALLKKSQSNNFMGNLLGVVGGFILGYQLVAITSNRSDGLTSLAVGAGLSVLSIPFSARAQRQSTKAVRLYNNSLGKTSYYHPAELKLKFIPNGLGLVLKF